jgi:hypothetical protein
MDGEMKRGFDSVSIVVEEEKHATSVSIHTLSWLGGAMPVGASMPGTKGRMAHNLRLASWEAATPISFETIPWERAHTGGGFSGAIL